VPVFTEPVNAPGADLNLSSDPFSVTLYEFELRAAGR
jgi:hypothetical protein